MADLCDKCLDKCLVIHARLEFSTTVPLPSE